MVCLVWVWKSGLPLIELRNVSGGERLVMEYLRRCSAEVVYTVQFSGDFGLGSWVTGGVETITPIDLAFERVVREDVIPASGVPGRIARLRMDLLNP